MYIGIFFWIGQNAISLFFFLNKMFFFNLNLSANEYFFIHFTNSCAIEFLMFKINFSRQMFAFSHKPKGKKRSSNQGSSSSEDLAVDRLSPDPSDSGSMSSASGPLQPLDNNSFVDCNQKTCIREPGQLDGRSFSIRNCTDSLLALLDHTSSISIEDCQNCILILGPCKGSVYLRNCSNCLLLAACQQFRATDCREMEAHLLVTTKPTIEDTDLIVAPLLMSYRKMDAHMAAAGLDRAVNRWKNVQNFTPDNGQFQPMPFDPFGNGAIACEVVTDELLERLSTFMEQSEAHELLLGPS